MKKLLAVVALTLLMLAPAYAWQDVDEDDSYGYDSDYDYDSSDSYSSPYDESSDRFLSPGMKTEGIDYYGTDDGDGIVDPSTGQEYDEYDKLPNGRYYYKIGDSTDNVYVK